MDDLTSTRVGHLIADTVHSYLSDTLIGVMVRSSRYVDFVMTKNTEKDCIEFALLVRERIGGDPIWKKASSDYMNLLTEATMAEIALLLSCSSRPLLD